MKNRNLKSKTKKSLIFLFSEFKIFLLFIIILNQSFQECPKDYPILKYDNCTSDYCTKEQFYRKECIINNDIIKTQWLNNIIDLEMTHFKYVNLASYSNGDLILQVDPYPADEIRRFLGFKKNGRNFFEGKAENQFNYIYSKNVSQNINGKFESTNIVIKLNGNVNNKKEYLISLSKEDSYVEIYDFENDKIYQKHLYDFSGLSYINSYQNVAIPLPSSNNEHYYLFGFIGETNKEQFVVQKHIFNSLDNFSNEATVKNTLKISDFYSIDQKDTGFSCFQTKLLIIICFFLTSDKKYFIVAYDDNLNKKTEINFQPNDIFFNQIFYKCIHLKEEVGIFIYYNKYKKYYYPVLLFKEYNNLPQIINYSISEIILNTIEIQYDPYLFLNDLIKLKNNKICFCSPNYEVKDKLYIVIINLFLNSKYKIRYYLIDLYNLYSHKIDLYLRVHKYNNFISIAFDYSNDKNEKCDGSSWGDYCAALLIFSYYPNSTDNSLFLDEYLKNNLTLSYININLENEVRIENNIFGNIFSGIEIINLQNCDNLKIKSSLHNDNIYSSYTLKKDEVIKLEFSGISYDAFTCNLQYSYKITEPDLNEYDRYPIVLNGTANETNSNFEKEEYIGRLTYFYIILKEDLSNECNNYNCLLCFKNNKDFCMECKYNFTYFENGKNCSDNIIKIGDIEIIKIEIEKNKEQLFEELPKIRDTIDIGKNYIVRGEEYNLVIKPTNISIASYTHVDFSSCEKQLRRHYNISNSRIITFLQLELEDKNTQSLVNQVGYQVYDDEKNILDLSICSDTNIQIFYLIKSNSSIDISFISTFKGNNIDIFNITDYFFNDICSSYSDSGNDVVLKDRINDFYQNYSLCDEGCIYNEINLELMMITCDCKVKQNITNKLINASLVQMNNIRKSKAFEIIKCYKLVFSLDNIGFLIFTIFILLHIPSLIIFFNKGIKSMKNYLDIIMKKNGYINNNDIEKIINNKENDENSLNIKIKNKISYPPPKNKNTNNIFIIIIKKHFMILF